MSSEGWKEAVVEEWRKRRNAERKPPSMGFPLISNTTGEEELADITKLVTMYGSEPSWTPLSKSIEQTLQWFTTHH